MKDIITNLTEQFRQRHREARRYVAMLLVLALVTTMFVNWQLHGVGISMTADYHCGYEEHQHTEACYEKVLTCGYEEGEPEDPEASSLPEEADLDSDFGVDAEPEYELQTQTILVPHIHTDACYEEQQELTCFEEEHEHTDDCFDEEGALICGKFEHVHDDSCYTTEDVLVCGKEDGELDEEEVTYEVPVSTRPIVIEPAAPAEDTNEETVHHHTDACYTEELVCTIPEHHHTVECLADEQVDVETPEEWQAAANVTLNGSWPEDLVAVAKSQLGYQESEKNFKLDTEDQATVRGYSRYGAWYGNPYGEWDVMFLSYCLQFAGVPQSAVPQRAGVQALHSELRGSPWLTDGDGTTAQVGDLVIYNLTSTEQVVVNEDAGIALLDLDADTNMDPDLDADMAVETAQPEVEDRVVTDETVGIVVGLDPDTGDLTVISGDVEGQVAQLTLAPGEVTSVISVTGAYAAETTAAAPEDPAGSQEELDSSYGLLEDEEGFGATVEWVGDADPYGIALLAAEDPYDLNTWITDVIYEKTIDGKTWTSIGAGSVTVESGTHVRVNLKYTVKPGVLTPTNKTLTYQLPKGLRMPDVMKGNIVDESDKDKADNAKVVGSYFIDTDGKVTLTFTDEKFIGTNDKAGLEFIGTFKFSQKVWADDFANDKTITFENGYTLTIKAKKADVTVQKSGGSPAFDTRSDGTFVNNYEVTVGTTCGTKDPVTLTDTLNTNKDGNSADDYLKGGTYLVDSFKLYKVDASGVKTEISFPNYRIQTDSRGNPQVVLDPLDPLDIEEKYIWDYGIQRKYADFDETANGSGTIFNAATAQAGGNKATDDAKYTMPNARIEKNGEYDPKTGHIQWTITVKAPHSLLRSYFLRGSKITDDLPDRVKIVGDVKVGNDTISAEVFLKDGYTIPDTFTGTELTITFETTTPLDGGSVTNTAQIETKSKHIFTALATKNIGQGDWTLSKQLASSSKGLAKWNISAANAAGESSFTLVETLQDAVNESGQTQLNTHYAYAKELEQALETGLTLTLHDGGTMTYADAKADKVITVTYYSGANGTGGTVTADDPSIRVQSFTIQIKKADDNPVRRVEVKDLPTHEDRSKVPTGEKWTYKNSVSIQSSSQRAEAEDTYHSYKSFEKRVSANSDQDESGYQSGDQTYQYSKLDGKNLHYQLVVQTAADDDADIVITDTLPKNTKFKTDWVTIGMDEGTPDKVNALKRATATVAYEETTRKLTITISGYNQNAQHKFRILYKVSVSDDPRWKNPSVGELTYTNSATWGERTETTTTTVTRDVEQVKKTGWQDPGNNRKLHYWVVINPAGDDLSAAKDHAPTIELWDNISTTNGAIATGDVNSVKLYYYDYNETEGVILGQEVDRDLYRILEADEDGWLHMVVPNEAALILVYDCNVKDGSAAASYEVSNTVTLSNQSKSSDSGFTYKVTADATATTAQFVLRKKSSYYGVSLEGAVFTIYQYNKETEAWTKWAGNSTGTLTTDKNGQASLAVLDSKTESCLHPDVLYKLVETKAPTDYQLDDTPHYLLFRKSARAESAEKAFAAATGAPGTTLTVGNETVYLNNNVQVGSDAGTTTAEYSNVHSNLTVRKLWLDQDTKQPVKPAVNSIRIKVWQYTDNDKKLFAEADLTARNDWTWSEPGDKLPLTDGKGNAYHYLVEEVTTGNWNVYIDNNDVQTGNITIRNYVYTGYELPSTGGMGTAPFGVLGGALAAAAALLLVRKRKQNEEE